MSITEAKRLRRTSAPDSARHRTGPSKGTHSGLRRGQLPVEKDAVVIARIEQGQALALQGRSVAEIALLQGVSVETVYLDKRRAREFIKDRVLATKADVIADLELVKQRALQLLDETGNQSLNKSAYLSVYRQAAMDVFKVVGLEAAQKLEVTLHNGDRDLDAEIEQLLADRLAKPRLVVQSEAEVEADRTA